MTRSWSRAALLTMMLLALATNAADAGLAEWNGHLGIGYAKLFAHDRDPRSILGQEQRQTPAGSLSLAAGADYPITRSLRGGIGIGYHLLGSRTLVRGSQFANVDYSVFDVALLAHWIPMAGPVGRVSFGPALISSHADLSTGGGGASFSDLAVSETAPGFALDATLMPRSDAPVRVGLELGTRVGFLEQEIWTLATARFAFHY
jgi:hypothetical protein